jgi:hypothetical protein
MKQQVRVDVQTGTQLESDGISEAYSTLPGTQSESDSVPEPTWSSIYTTEYNRMHATIVLVSKQKSV